MRVLLSTYGSRGDTEPMAALGAALQALGAEAIVSAPPEEEFEHLLARAGVPMAPAFYSVRQWIKDKPKPSSPADFAKLTAEMIAGQYEAISRAAEGCDLIVAAGLPGSKGAARSVAEVRGLRYASATYCPLFFPSHHQRPFEYPGRPFPPGVTDNRVLWDHNRETMQQNFGGALNAHRASIGLPPTGNLRDHILGDRPLLASDPVLWPWEASDLCNGVQTGAWILPDTRPLPADLLAFLDAGAPPVYAGFGSIAVQSPQETARACIEAIRAHGRRAMVHRGWADLGLIDNQPDCFAVGDVNQQALFPRCAAVIHHGGAGTTTAAARAGASQVVAPQIVDQPYWAQRVAALGIGAAHEGPAPTRDSLTAALKIALAPETTARATAIAPTIRADGARVAARLLLDTPGG